MAYLTLARTSYYAILERTLGGGHTPVRLPPNRNRDSKQKQTERSRCFESNHIRFYYLRSHFDLSGAGQTKNVAFWEDQVFGEYLLN